ncbi:MAG: DUF1080 domain-containing protein [Clostridia bacterium]|nr:DUF1080 domain-containing protein [Clostridia bacterium]
MKKLSLILGFVFAAFLSVCTLFAPENTVALAEEKWDDTETFDNVSSINDKFDFYFCSSQNARRSDELSYTWNVENGCITREGNIDVEDTTINIAVMTYIGEVYDDFELSVDFKAGSLTPLWPVIGIRQQIPGKNFTVDGGGAGVFMQQNGKITFWGPIVGSTVVEWDIPDIADYYALVWHNMRILAEGSSVKVFIDGNIVADMTVSATDYTKGYISLISVNNDCSFDNFKVRALGGTGKKGNEENNYAYADLGQDLDEITGGAYTPVKLPEEQSSTEVGVPSVTPALKTVSIDDGDSEVDFAVNYNNGEFKSLKLNGLIVGEENYSRLAATITLKSEYVKRLPVGENVFTVTATGGTADFTLTVERESVSFTDGVRVKKFYSVDVSFKMDFGTTALDKVTFGGAIMPDGTYYYKNGALRIRKEYLSKLDNGVYEVIVYDKSGNAVDCFVTVGVEPSETFILNFDGLKPETNGYGQDLAVSDREGLYGLGGGIKCDKAGTLLIFDGDNINYNFVSGKTYSVTTYLKFNRTVDGTSSVLDLLMPIYFKTTGGNADLGYLRYNALSGYYFHKEPNCLTSSFTKVGEWYRLSFAFTYNQAWQRLEFPVWMVTDFTIDNFVLAPLSDAVASAELPEEISVAKNTQNDVVIDCASSVLGINFNGRALTENEYSYSDGKLTIKREFISSLTDGENELTVYFGNSYRKIILNVDIYSFSVTGNTNYRLGGGDLTLTLNTAPFQLGGATLFGEEKTLVKNTDYAVDGNKLVLYESYLETLAISEKITVAFTETAKLKFTVTTNKLLAADFDNRLISVGFAYNMAQSATDGKSGNGIRLTNTMGATLLALGGEFYPVKFEAGKTYSFSFDMKIEEIKTETNFIIAGNSCYMPVTFGPGKDVTYLRVTKTGDGYKIAHDRQSVSESAFITEPDENGFITVSFTFIPNEACTALTFDVWMPSTIVVDNLTLIEL